MIKQEDGGLNQFSQTEIENAREICREVIEKRFLSPDADFMVRSLFQAVLEHSAKRILSGRQEP